MSRLLVVEASPAGDASISRRLTAHFVEQWQDAFPGGDVMRRDLIETGIPLIDAAWIKGAFTHPDTHSPASAEAMRISDALIAEVLAADHILFGTPMHNLMIPAVLKAYIDQIVRVGSTVSDTNEGLVIGKRSAVILASGGDFSPGAPAEQFNLATPYLRAVLGFIGLTDVQFILAGPTRLVTMGQQGADDFLARFEPSVQNTIASWSPAVSS